MISSSVTLLRTVRNDDIFIHVSTDSVTIYECKIIYHVRKSPWTRRRAEGEWEGQILDGWME